MNIKSYGFRLLAAKLDDVNISDSNRRELQMLKDKVISAEITAHDAEHAENELIDFDTDDADIMRGRALAVIAHYRLVSEKWESAAVHALNVNNPPF